MQKPFARLLAKSPLYVVPKLAEIDNTTLAAPEAMISQALMILRNGGMLDDVLAARLEAIAQDASLPKTLRARALVNLSRNR